MTERLPDILTEQEWQAFISTFNTKAPTGLRNAALFTLMHEAGLRTCEVIGLKTANIRQDSFDGRPVTVLTLKVTKGGKERNVYLSEEADRLLQAWLQKKSDLGLGRHKHVFTTLKGGAVDSGYMRTLCARKGFEAGTGWRVHPHALRHTFATNLLEDTGNLALVQDALGHASPETTRVYAKVRDSHLAAAMTKRGQQPASTDIQQQIAALQEQLDALQKAAGLG